MVQTPKLGHLGQTLRNEVIWKINNLDNKNTWNLNHSSKKVTSGPSLYSRLQKKIIIGQIDLDVSRNIF